MSDTSAAEAVYGILKEDPTTSIAEIAKRTKLTMAGVRYHTLRLAGLGRLKRIEPIKGQWLAV